MSPLYAMPMNAAPDTCLVLRRGAHTVQVAPKAGGRILSWSTELPAGTRDWLVPVTTTEWSASTWPKGGIFPLAPFSNRVRDAQLQWQGRMIPLEPLPGTPHALHGQAQGMPWVVEEVINDCAILALSHPPGIGGWPWAWHLRETIQLTDEGLRIDLVLENRDTTPMPAGLGIHPYFTAQSVQLTAPTRWVHEQELALYAEANTETHWARQGETTWTQFLSGWDGRADIAWPEGPGLTMQCHGPLTHMVLHCNAGRYLCVEPATHVCDAFNLTAAGVQGTGMQVLEPGAVLAAGMHLGVMIPHTQVRVET